MRTILHLSDLHFGRIDERLLGPLVEAVGAIDPDMVVVSGDLTQRARSEQFRAAKEFLDALPGPQIVVPGNHDVPMHNPVARFFYPLAGYRRYFADPEPFYKDAEIAVLGLNSSRSLTIEDGRLNERQIARLVNVFGSIPQGVTKILVCHHPFSLQPGDRKHRVVGGAARVLAAMTTCGTDVVLSGHLHTSHVSCTELKQDGSGWAVVLSQAGTSTSTRLRGQLPSFSVLRVGLKELAIQPYDWEVETGRFAAGRGQHFARGEFGWKEVAGL